MSRTSQLLSNFPQSWQGLLDVLSGQERALISAELWLREVRDSSSKWLCWTELMEALTEAEPEIQKGKLNFKPRVLHLSLHLQRLLLAFLHRHRHEIEDHDLQNFVKVMEDISYNDHWIKILVGKLLDHLPTKHTRPWVGYSFSPDMKNEMENVVLKVCEAERLRPVRSPWRRCFVRKSVKSSPAKADNVDDSLLWGTPEASDIDTPLASDNRLLRDSQAFQDGTPNKRLKLDYSQSESVDGTVTPPCGLSLDLQNCVCGLKETWCSGLADPEVPPADLRSLLACTPEQMQLIVDQLELSSLSEVAMAIVCQHMTFLATELSHTNGVCIAQACILPKVMDLKQTASRVLLGASTIFATHFPKQTIEGVLVPCVTSPDIGGAQADLVVRILKDTFKVEYRIDFLSQVVATGGVWNESVVMVLQPLVDMKISLTTEMLTGVVSCLQNSAPSFMDSLKFSKLLLAVINKYGKQFAPGHVTGMRQVTEMNNTFLKKSVTAALNRLKI